jgi:hypothetical protein
MIVLFADADVGVDVDTTMYLDITVRGWRGGFDGEQSGASLPGEHRGRVLNLTQICNIPSPATLESSWRMKCATAEPTHTILSDYFQHLDTSI